MEIAAPHPVEVIGFDSVPQAGDDFTVVTDEKEPRAGRSTNAETGSWSWPKSG